jgi:predicted tellurium resistance membrane protein TerC
MFVWRPYKTCRNKADRAKFSPNQGSGKPVEFLRCTFTLTLHFPEIPTMIDFSLPFTLSALFTLGMLVLLQAVLGFDNLLYISLESKRVREDQQSYVRKMGIGVAIFLRIALLFIVLLAIDNLKSPFFEFGLQSAPEQASAVASDSEHAAEHVVRQPNASGRFFAGSFNVHSIIVLVGGIFIIYTAFKEIMHMLAINHLEDHTDERKPRSVGVAIFWIVVMNLVFSFDSILSAIALTHNVWVMSLAVIVSGVLMILLADHVAEFLKKNRMYEVLGLFILFIVGVMLVSEGGHLAHLHLFGYVIEPMAKSTFYFVIGILVVVDVIQSKYQKKLMAQSEAEESGVKAS